MAEDEIETVQTIEKAARTRYLALGGVLARAAEGPAIASERFAWGETVVAEHNGEPAGFVLLQPLEGLQAALVRRVPALFYLFPRAPIPAIVLMRLN